MIYDLSVSIFTIYYARDANVNALGIRQRHLSFQPSSETNVAETVGGLPTVQHPFYPLSILERRKEPHFPASLSKLVVKELQMALSTHKPAPNMWRDGHKSTSWSLIFKNYKLSYQSVK